MAFFCIPFSDFFLALWNKWQGQTSLCERKSKEKGKVFFTFSEKRKP
jgi:hypothetical protein